MSSVCYNPFIYCWLNSTFRNEAKNFLFCILHCQYTGQNRVINHGGDDDDLHDGNGNINLRIRRVSSYMTAYDNDLTLSTTIPNCPNHLSPNGSGNSQGNGNGNGNGNPNGNWDGNGNGNGNRNGNGNENGNGNDNADSLPVKTNSNPDLEKNSSNSLANKNVGNEQEQKDEVIKIDIDNSATKVRVTNRYNRLTNYYIVKYQQKENGNHKIDKNHKNESLEKSNLN